MAPDSGSVSELFAFVVTKVLPLELLSLEIGAGASSRQLQVASSERVTCAALVDGTVKCWGFGELGNATVQDSSTPLPVTGISAARMVATSRSSSGRSHACAVLADGAVRCWGSNGEGQLGNGTLADSPTPVAVTGISTARAVSVGTTFACALLADGNVRCWGGVQTDNKGVLGVGTDTGSTTPLTTAITGVAALTSNGRSTCALQTGGTIKCWGVNARGNLGTGAAGPQDCDGTACALSPVAVAGISNAVQVSTSGTHTCATLADGKVRCWGTNAAGQLGNGDMIDTRGPVAVNGVTTATAVSTGGNHTCVLLADSTVKCFGASTSLGNGAQTSPTPVLVTGITTAIGLSAGFDYTCATLANGGATCWGINFNGQLGNATKTNAPLPVAVVGIP